jgi:hypothetical protein
MVESEAPRAVRFTMRRALRFLWPDEAVWFALLGRAFSFVSTPITLLLVATRFTPIYQGFYYTFTTITALVILLEFGLGMVLTYFASHEFAHLSWDADGGLSGEEGPRAHLLGILVKALRWYGVVALIAVVLFIPGGFVFFGGQARAEHVSYIGPWIVLVTLTALGLVAIPIVSVIEGCGRVPDITRLRLAQAVISALLLWLGLLTGQALYAAAFAALGPVLAPAVWLALRYRGLVRQVAGAAGHHLDAAVSWRNELLPMQWRIALSWLGGYLVFSLFNPLLFRYQGAVPAGQMGMSLTLANAPFAVAMAWLATRAPQYGTLIRLRQFDALDRVARKSTLQAAVVWAAGSAAVLVAVAAGQSLAPSLAHRVLSIPSIAALCVASLVNVLMYSMASYLRAHKEEPYVGVSVATGALVAAGLWVAARFSTPFAMAITYAAIVVTFELPIAAAIFVRKRHEWHAVSSA